MRIILLAIACCTIGLVTSCSRSLNDATLTEPQVLEFCKRLEAASLQPDVDVTMSFFASNATIIVKNAHKPDQKPIIFDKAKYHAHMQHYFQITSNLTGGVTGRNITIQNDGTSAIVKTTAKAEATRGGDHRKWSTEKDMTVELIESKLLITRVTATSKWIRNSNK